MRIRDCEGWGWQHPHLLGDSCIVNRAADLSSIHVGRNASELSGCRTTAISTLFVTSRRLTITVSPNRGWNG